MSIFFIGDSRTVGQAKENGFPRTGSTVVGKNNQGDYYYAKVGEGLQWFNKNTPDIIQKSKDYDAIVVSLGVNDITNKQKYVAKMKELANGPWKGKRIYFTSVNPVDRTKYKGLVTNHMIDEFNSYVKKNLPSNIRFIDTNTHFKDKFQYTDGLHYKSQTNEAINDFITAEIQRDCAQMGYTQQQTVPENTGTGVNESTKEAMLKDQAKAQKTKQLLDSDNAETSNAFGKVFAGNWENNLLWMLVSILLTGKLPETSEKKEQAVQSADMDYTTNPVSTPIASSQRQYSSLKDYAVKKWGKSSKSNVAEISDYIIKYSKQYGVDPCFAFAIAEQESNFNQNIGSKAGAWGVFQLMPATAKGLGVDRTNMEQNIKGGIKYLSQLMKQYNGDLLKTAKAYNWGPGYLNNALKRGVSAQNAGVGNKEVRNYAPSVLQRMDKYRNAIGINQSMYAQYYGNNQNQNYLALNSQKGNSGRA